MKRGRGKRSPTGRGPDGSRYGNHIIISGTGRAGTTFLVQYLTAIGFDTGYSIDEAIAKVDPISSAGLERGLTEGDLPYVLKSPWFAEYLESALASGRLKVACAIIPVRDLQGAAQSRRRVYREARAQGFDPLSHRGSLWKTRDPSGQENVLTLLFYKLVESLVRHDVPIRLLTFPGFIESHHLLYGPLESLLTSHGISKSASLRAHRELARPDLIHDFGPSPSTPHGAEAAHKQRAGEPAMDYRVALALAHSILQPELYVEIGCARGASLALSRCPTVAIDPAFEITFPLIAPTRIFRQTSDAFFNRTDVARIFGGAVGLAFIDGMHLVENVIRDFVNLERFAAGRSVIFMDDVLPRNMAWATRSRQEGYWTGDVYRTILVLRKYRPDLSIEIFDVDVKGVAVITKLNRNDEAISSNWNGIESEIASGLYCMADVEGLRAALAPRPAAELEGHLRKIAAL